MQPDEGISWDVSKSDAALVQQIADRFGAELKRLGKPFTKASRLDLVMDLEACHANGMPMRFDLLLAADDFNFTHDITGIQRHIDRETGTLQNCFVPRFAAHQHVGR